MTRWIAVACGSWARASDSHAWARIGEREPPHVAMFGHRALYGPSPRGVSLMAERATDDLRRRRRSTGLGSDDWPPASAPLAEEGHRSYPWLR